MRRALAAGLPVMVLGCAEPAPPQVRAHYQVELVEGQGCAADGCAARCDASGCTDGRRPALLVLDTSARIDEVRAAIAGVDVPVTVDVLARTTGAVDRTAVAVRIPVSTALAPARYPLVVTLTAGGDATTVELVAEGLGELVLGSVNPWTQGRYASAIVPTAIVAGFGSDEPIVIETTSDIVLAGVVSADATAARPGPGGCRALAGLERPCGDGDGGGSATDAGGGGGFGTAGAGALGGAATGTPTLVPLGPGRLPADDNRGHAGGAHGAALGGHGGGSVLLAASGRIGFGQFARVTARGGEPAPAVGPRGGGGSGGAVILQAQAGFDLVDAAAEIVDVRGGLGAGLGRVRLDGPEPRPAAPAAWRGPSWQGAPLVLADGAALTLALDPRQVEPIEIEIGEDGATATCAPIAGACTFTPALSVGVTRLCAKATAAATAALPENRACVDVARL
ncbi:MAG: hypothetical protein IPL61_20915 [Myxococcales bacterium]|nr:hypothetical protein [Myxococcales bacterium]